MTAPTPAELFAYANRFARRAENAGRGTRYPTLSRAARRFRCRIADIESAIDDYQGDGYMGIAVGVQSAAGIAVYATRGECLVEAYQ